jgi:hypothetical protein
MIYGVASPGTEEEFATTVFAKIVKCADRTCAKLFTPDAGWTWFITEGSEEEDGDWLLFGYVIGLDEEWGYFLLSEIASIRSPLGLAVERDLWFQPGPIDEVLRRERPSHKEIGAPK